MCRSWRSSVSGPEHKDGLPDELSSPSPIRSTAIGSGRRRARPVVLVLAGKDRETTGSVPKFRAVNDVVPSRFCESVVIVLAGQLHGREDPAFAVEQEEPIAPHRSVYPCRPSDADAPALPSLSEALPLAERVVISVERLALRATAASSRQILAVSNSARRLMRLREACASASTRSAAAMHSC